MKGVMRQILQEEVPNYSIQQNKDDWVSLQHLQLLQNTWSVYFHHVMQCSLIDFLSPSVLAQSAIRTIFKKRGRQRDRKLNKFFHF